MVFYWIFKKKMWPYKFKMQDKPNIIFEIFTGKEVLKLYRNYIKDLSNILALYGSINCAIWQFLVPTNEIGPFWQCIAPETAIPCQCMAPFWYENDSGCRNLHNGAVSGARYLQNGEVSRIWLFLDLLIKNLFLFATWF